MIQMMLGLYLKSLLLSAVVVGISCLVWLSGRLARRVDNTPQERQEVLYETLMVMIVSIPILAFGILAILMMLQVK